MDSNTIIDYTNAIHQRFIDEVEKACERALQCGDRGVFVLRDKSGMLKWASPHRDVPYGHIYEAQEPLADNFWEKLRKHGQQ